MHSLVECVVALRLSLVACDQLRAIAHSARLLTVVTVESHEDTLVKRDMDGKEYRGSTRRDNDTRPIPPQRVCVRSSCIALRFSRIFCEFSATVPGRFRAGERRVSIVVHLPHQKEVLSPLLPLFHSTSSSLLFFFSNERPYTNPG